MVMPQQAASFLCCCAYGRVWAMVMDGMKHTLSTKMRYRKMATIGIIPSPNAVRHTPCEWTATPSKRQRGEATSADTFAGPQIYKHYAKPAINRLLVRGQLRLLADS